MISRRTFGAGLAGAAATLSSGPALAQSAARSELRIFLEDREVGAYGIEITREDRSVRASVDIDIRLRSFAGLPLLGYRLRSEEAWVDGRLQSLTSTVRAAGEERSIVAGRMGGSLRVESEAFTGQVPQTSGTSSYFSRDLLDRSTWISTDSGKLLSVTSERTRRVEIAGREFDEFVTGGDFESRLFYTEDGRLGGAIFEIMGKPARILPGTIGDTPANLT